MENSTKNLNNGSATSNHRFDHLEHQLRRSIEQNSSTPETYFSLGLVCKSTRRLDEAAHYFAQAIKLKADYPEAYNSLALTLCSLQRFDQAQACLLKAIELKSDYAEAYNNLGIVQVRRKLPEEAVESFRKAVRLGPVNPSLLNNLGLALYGLEQFEESLDYFRQATEIDPNYTEAHYNLGCSLKELKRAAEAIPCFQRAIELQADYLSAYENLATMLFTANRLVEAEACLRRAIALDPDFADAHRVLGRVLKMMHRLDEAEASYQRAIDVSHPDQLDDSLFGYGILCLLRGQYPRGWEYYDLRRSLYNYPEPEFPYWRGESLQNKTILLFCEQGYGDTLQFVRYAAQVAALAKKTDVRVQLPLQKLLAASLPDCTVYSGAVRPAEHYDFACSLHSLPFVFQSTEETIPQRNGYLQPAAKLIKKWRGILNRATGGEGFRVGIVWAGNPKHHNNHNRSISFQLFSRLLAVAPLTWVSLQVGDRAQDLCQTTQPVFDASPQIRDYGDTAGLVQNLDLVITVDSSVAHLAGALGKPTWLLLPYAPDWRWQLDREDTPWYSSVRLFRQQQLDTWPEVLQRVGAALQDLLHSQPSRKSQ